MSDQAEVPHTPPGGVPVSAEGDALPLVAEDSANVLSEDKPSSRPASRARRRPVSRQAVEETEQTSTGAQDDITNATLDDKTTTPTTTTPNAEGAEKDGYETQEVEHTPAAAAIAADDSESSPDAVQRTASLPQLVQQRGQGEESPRTQYTGSPIVLFRADLHRRELNEAVPQSPLDDAEALENMRSAVRTAEARYTYAALSPSPNALLRARTRASEVAEAMHTPTGRAASAIDAAVEAATSAVARSRLSRGGLNPAGPTGEMQKPPGSAPALHVYAAYSPSPNALVRASGGVAELPEAARSPVTFAREYAAAASPTLPPLWQVSTAPPDWSYVPKHRKKRLQALRGLPGTAEARKVDDGGSTSRRTPRVQQTSPDVPPPTAASNSGWSPAPGWVSVHLTIGNERRPIAVAEAELPTSARSLPTPRRLPSMTDDGENAPEMPQTAVSMPESRKPPLHIGLRGGNPAIRDAMLIATSVAERTATERAEKAKPILWAPKYFHGYVRRLEEKLGDLERLIAISGIESMNAHQLKELKESVPKLQYELDFYHDRSLALDSAVAMIHMRWRHERIRRIVNDAGQKLRILQLKGRAKDVVQIREELANLQTRTTYLESIGMTSYAELERCMLSKVPPMMDSDSVGAAAWDHHTLTQDLAPMIDLLAASLGEGSSVLLALVPGTPVEAIDLDSNYESTSPKKVFKEKPIYEMTPEEILVSKYKLQPLNVSSYRTSLKSLTQSPLLPEIPGGEEHVQEFGESINMEVDSLCFSAHNTMHEQFKHVNVAEAENADLDPWLEVALRTCRNAEERSEEIAQSRECNFFAVPLCSLIGKRDGPTPPPQDYDTKNTRKSFGVLGVDTSRCKYGTTRLSEGQKDTIRKVALNLSIIVYRAQLAAAKELKQFAVAQHNMRVKDQQSTAALMELIAQARVMREQLQMRLSTASSRSMLRELKDYTIPPRFAVEVLLATLCVTCVKIPQIENVPMHGNDEDEDSPAGSPRLRREKNLRREEEPMSESEHTRPYVFAYKHKFGQYLEKADSDQKTELWEEIRKALIIGRVSLEQLCVNAPLTDQEARSMARAMPGASRQSRAMVSARGESAFSSYLNRPSSQARSDSVLSSVAAPSRLSGELDRDDVNDARPETLDESRPKTPMESIPDVEAAHDEATSILINIGSRRNVARSASSLLHVYNWLMNMLAARAWVMKKENLIRMGDGTDYTLKEDEQTSGHGDELSLVDILEGMNANKRVKRKPKLEELERKLGEYGIGGSPSRLPGASEPKDAPESPTKLSGVSFGNLAMGMLSAVKKRMHRRAHSQEPLDDSQHSLANYIEDDDAGARAGKDPVAKAALARMPSGVKLHEGFFKGNPKRKLRLMSRGGASLSTTRLTKLGLKDSYL